MTDRTERSRVPESTGARLPLSLSRPRPGESLAERHPDIAATADGWEPTHVSAGSRAVTPWWCPCCGTTWMAEVRARSRGYRACPTCSADEHPPLTVTHPDLAEQMVEPFRADDYTHGSKRKVRWRGPLGHEWEATVANRVKGSGCPVCAIAAAARAHRKPPPGGSLADTHPAAAADADGRDPSEFRPTSNARLPWRCAECGHRWTTTVYHRTQGPGCPACARTR